MMTKIAKTRGTQVLVARVPVGPDDAPARVGWSVAGGVGGVVYTSHGVSPDPLGMLSIAAAPASDLDFDSGGGASDDLRMVCVWKDGGSVDWQLSWIERRGAVTHECREACVVEPDDDEIAARAASAFAFLDGWFSWQDDHAE